MGGLPYLGAESVETIAITRGNASGGGVLVVVVVVILSLPSLLLGNFESWLLLLGEDGCAGGSSDERKLDTLALSASPTLSASFLAVHFFIQPCSAMS